MNGCRIRDPADGRIGNLWALGIDVDDVEELVSVIREVIDDFRALAGRRIYRAPTNPGGSCCHVAQDRFCLNVGGIELAMNNQGQVHPRAELSGFRFLGFYSTKKDSQERERIPVGKWGTPVEG